MKIESNKGTVVIGGKQMSNDKARKLITYIKNKKKALFSKLNKTENRIILLKRFLTETGGKDNTLGYWMESKGLDYRKLFSSLGYYTTLNLAVSSDSENSILDYDNDMTFNKDVGYFLPKREVVKISDHNNVTNSRFGMTYNPNLALYFPTTIYDLGIYDSTEKSGDSTMDIMGGFSSQDLSNLSADLFSGKELILTIIDLYEDEYDNVSDELESIENFEIKNIGIGEFSSADGAGKNALCRTSCEIKHRFSKTKRDACKDECDEKFTPSENQENRRGDRTDRRDARGTKRKTKQELKEAYKKGDITWSEYKNLWDDAKDEKRQSIKESGGNFLVRYARGMAKVMPITASSRGGALILAKNNVWGFSTRLAPALLPNNIANKKFRPQAIVKSKKGWEKVSKAWRNLGGNPDKLKESILEGFSKKPMKMSKKSNITGVNYSYTTYSNVVGVSIGTAMAIGSTVVSSLVTILKKTDVDADPYKKGLTPEGYLDNVETNPPTEPSEPQYDIEKNQWIDPDTGKSINPQTGEFIAENIFGVNKNIVIGIGAVLLLGSIFLILKKTK